MVEHERTGVVDMVTWSFSRVAMWAPAFIVAIILYEVFNRYILGQGTYWVNEMSLWVAGGVYLTAGLYAMQQRSHIRIFILYDMAPLWLRRVFDVIGVLAVCIFAFATVWGGFNNALASFLRWERFGTVFDPPIQGTIKPLVLVLMVVLAVQAVSNLIRDWPAPRIVRKAFDAFAFLLIMVGVFYTLRFTVPFLIGAERVWGTRPVLVPTAWLWAITIFVIVVAGLAIYGLLRDFNRDPVPHVESHDPADELDLDYEALGLSEAEREASDPLHAVAEEGRLAEPNEYISGNPPVPGKKEHP